MQTILTSIAKVIAIPIVSILTFAGYDVSSSIPLQQKINTLDNKVQSIGTEVNQVKLGAYNPTGGGTYRLQSSIGSTDTTIKLSSFKEPVSNLPYTMSYLNTSVAYGTLDPQQPTRSEFISFTGITQNADGTATLTGVTRGLARSYPYTASLTLRQTHSGQSIFILSDSPQHFAEYAVKANDEVITGTWTFNNFPITASTTYASETVAGASELATGVEIASSTSTGGTTRRLTIPASLATSTYNSATAGLKVVVTQNDGKINNNFISTSTLGLVTYNSTNGITLTGTSTFATTTLTIASSSRPLLTGGIQSFDLSTASGNTAIAHGLGYTPRFVKITNSHTHTRSNQYSGMMSTASTIYYNDTQSSTYMRFQSGDGTSSEGTVGNTFTIFGQQSNYYQQGVITTDATNININFTKAGSPTGNTDLVWEAY